MLGSHMDYLPATPESWAWIDDTFGWRLREMTCGPRDVGAQVAALHRVLFTGAGTALVSSPIGYPDEWTGWAVGLGGSLVFAYVREEFRKQGIGHRLIVRSTQGQPVHVAYWTEDAEEMQAHGYPIAYDIRAYQALLAFVRGPERRRRIRAVPVAA